jgi:exosortase
MEQTVLSDEIKPTVVEPVNPLSQMLDFLKKIDWISLPKHKFFLPTLLILSGLGLLFWRMALKTGALWINDDYYSHGFLVPILIGWQLSVRKDLFQKSPRKQSNFPLIFIPVLLYLQLIGFRGDVWPLQSVVLVATLICGVWFVAGGKWALISSLPIAFFFFALPVWTSFVDEYTNPLQLASTTVAEKLLGLFGFNPMKISPTEIQLNRFTLDVAVPCSGLKLLVAVSCFTCHFVLIARNSWSFNILMFVMVMPLCLFINGLRIALIGVVGDQISAEAAGQFHDYSGYITLILCFYILFKFARWFGWKD